MNSSSSSQGATILAIDDNPSNLSLVTEYLEGHGFETLTARDGLDGLQKALYHPPDLILLDVLMPGIDGYETCRRLKSNLETQEIPIIFLTALSSTKDKLKGFAVGGVDYIIKPLQKQEVLARITTHLRIRDLTRQLSEANAMLAEQVSLEQKKVRNLAQRNVIIGQAIETSSDAVIIGDQDGKIVYLNTTFISRFAYTMDELNEAGGLPIIFTTPSLAQQMLQEIQNDQTWNSEANLRTKDGIKMAALVRTSRVWSNSGRVMGWVSLITDISDRKQIEEEKDRLLSWVEQNRQLLRTLSARLAETQETERKRLARELHDRVGQNLSTLGVILNIVRTQISTTIQNATPLLGRIDDALTLISQTTSHVRDVVADLRPPMLDDYGLVSTLEWYSRTFSRRIGIDIQVQGDEPEPRLPVQVENAVFRIAQEALTNVVKHAQASHITIQVATQGQMVAMMIEDNGIGFEDARHTSPGESRGWGLMTMSERAEAVGGFCRIESKAEQGTRVIVEVMR